MHSFKTFMVAVAGSGVALATTTVYPSRLPESTIEASLTQIVATEATEAALSPVSNVNGAAFNRIVQICLENTDYSAAAADPDMQWLASHGIPLSNFYATTYPSEPNYAAVVARDNLGMDNDDFNYIPSNISTLVDLLDTKGISWGGYQEGLPYAGFQGFNYSSQQNYSNNYVRKHNPLILFDSVTQSATRLSLIKNFTSFTSDLAAKTLPQWSFITPNMTDDGHDTTIAYHILQPLQHNVYRGAQLGPSFLGHLDCNTNVLQLVANKTNYANSVANIINLYFSSSYAGPVSDAEFVQVWPVPNTNANAYPYDSLTGDNVGGSASTPVASPTASATASATSSSASATKSSAAGMKEASISAVRVGFTALLMLN
ncbi:hypothetical protein G7Y89_g4491 [Cudoniella acicularis]|uniref:Acid phosphatase n=1 Tax=Cudoniella acicularis TaxID=354080 RepID=A0A8H4RPB7_9HELO|nr:hypothetical protein G7Y89_g4491 [Cudoniella acicularis]